MHMCASIIVKRQEPGRRKNTVKKINSKVWDNHKYSREISFFIRLRN